MTSIASSRREEEKKLEILIDEIRDRFVPVREGWLIKEGSFVKNWKRRYFILRNGKIFYYKDQRTAKTEPNDYRGVMSLEGCDVRYTGLRTQVAGDSEDEEEKIDDDSEDEQEREQQVLPGATMIQQAQTSLAITEQKVPLSAFRYKFQIAGPDRVLVMAATTIDIAREWIQVLKNAINIENYFAGCRRIGTAPLAGAIRVLADSSLKVLAVENERLTLKACMALSELIATNKTLTKLIIRNAGLTDEFMRCLSAGLAKNEVLHTVDFSNNRISDQGVDDLIDGLYVNISLQRLNLSQNFIGDLGAVHLSELMKANVALTNLNLSYNKIGEVGCTAIAKGLMSNTVLKELELGSNNIGNKGAEQLAHGLTRNKTLEHLGLSYNSIGSSGILVLCKELRNNRSIKDLDLVGNVFDKTGAKAIVDLMKDHKTLRRVNLGDIPSLGISGITTLAEVLKSRFMVSKLVMTRKTK